MITLESEVRSVVEGFLKADELFTALDVSNKVKLSLPLARHRDIREIVRKMFTTDMEPASYGRTEIEVTLTDGTTAKAMLYHPLVDSWDLDAKYDAQKRAQAALRGNPTAQLPQALTNDTSKFGWCGAPPPVSTAPAPTAAQLQARDLWKQMFSTQPSLFPRK